MKLYSLEMSTAIRPEILRIKRIYGFWFGVMLGVSFSVFAWGIDAYLLSRMHGLYPLLKFLGGVIPCMIVGGFTGWLVTKWDKPFLALLLWAAAASVFAWLTVSLPLQITPHILGIAEPGIKDLLHYTYYESFSTRVGLAYTWIAIFVVLAGFLQIPLSDSAVFSTSFFGKISPMLLTLILMAICGTIVDGLNNEKLRSPVETVNLTVQFMLDHRGEEIDATVSRQMHLRALRTVETLVTPEPTFIVSGYDEYLEEVQVLARFDNAWVECDLIVNQLIRCEQVGSPR